MAPLNASQRQELLWASADAGVQYDVEIRVDKRMEPPVGGWSGEGTPLTAGRPGGRGAAAGSGSRRAACSALRVARPAAPPPTHPPALSHTHSHPQIYLAFQLNSFFQNYRRYVRSLDSKVMHDGASDSVAAACAPFQYVPDPNGTLPYGGAINPCGQIANSNFNDTYTLSVVAPGGGGAGPLTLDDSDIAWPSDANHLYGPVPAVNFNQNPDTRGGATVATLLNQDQHWMVSARAWEGGRAGVRGGGGGGAWRRGAVVVRAAVGGRAVAPPPHSGRGALCPQPTRPTRPTPSLSLPPTHPSSAGVDAERRADSSTQAVRPDQRAH